MKINLKIFYFAVIFFACLNIFLNILTLGGITNDSGNYLALSQNLLLGKGFYIDNCLSEKSKDYFATFPVLYPVVIFLISKISNLSVFWSSKVLNLFVFLGFLVLFRNLVKDKVWYFIPIILFDSFQLVFYHSWSEPLFTLILFYFIIVFNKFYKNNNYSYKNILLLIILNFLLFTTRYIGVFTILFLCTYLAHSIFIKNYILTKKLLIVIFSSGFLIFIYVLNNYLNTSYLSGTNRDEDLGINILLLLGFFKNILFELSPYPSTSNLFHEIVLSTITISIGLFIIFKYLKNNDFKLSSFNFQLLLLAISYFVGLFLLRIIAKFDSFNPRLMFPGGFLLLFFTLIILNEYKLFRKIYAFFLIILILQLIPDLYSNLKSNESINKKIKLIENSDFPNNSILIGSSCPWIRFLRTDITQNFPNFPPYLTDENDLLELIKNNSCYEKHILLEKENSFSEEFINKLKENNFKIKLIEIK